MAEDWAIVLLWLNFGALLGTLYVLRRILLMEKKILNVESLIMRLEKGIAAKKKK
ncbi:MAG: hypothetical protein AABY09_00545 [Nanoarchaeota archaeon]